MMNLNTDYNVMEFPMMMFNGLTVNENLLLSYYIHLSKTEENYTPYSKWYIEVSAQGRVAKELPLSLSTIRLINKKLETMGIIRVKAITGNGGATYVRVLQDGLDKIA